MIQTCVSCEAPATHFLAASDPDDPHCDACYARVYRPCGRCERDVRDDQRVTVQTCRQTHWEPAEYDEGCLYCCPDGPDEPDDERED